MSTIFNGTTLDHIIYNSVDLEHLIVDGVEVFTRYNLPTTFEYAGGSGRLYGHSFNVNVLANYLYLIIFLGNKRNDGQEPNLTTNVSTSNSNILLSDYGSMSNNRRQTYLAFIPKQNFSCSIASSNDSQQSSAIIVKSNIMMQNDKFSANDFTFSTSHNSASLSQTQNNKWGFGLVSTSWYDTSEPSISINTNGSLILNKTDTQDSTAHMHTRIYNIQNQSFSASGNASSEYYPPQNWGGLIIKYNK